MDLAGNILRLCDGIADIFIPRACPACGCAMDSSEETICGACLLALHRAGVAVPGSKLMDTIANGPAPAGIAASWLRYRHDSPEARLIQSIKYRGRPRLGRDLGRVFGQELAARIQKENFSSSRGALAPRVASARPLPEGMLKPADIDVLIPVPLYWTKRLRRGFNQSEWIAEGIADALGCGVATCLRAVRPHATQTHKTDQGRAENIVGIFALDKDAKLDGLNIAVVDDVITTGATVREAILTIGRAGARPATVSVLSLALAGLD